MDNECDEDDLRKGVEYDFDRNILVHRDGLELLLELEFEPLTIELDDKLLEVLLISSLDISPTIFVTLYNRNTNFVSLTINVNPIVELI